MNRAARARWFRLAALFLCAGIAAGGAAGQNPQSGKVGQIRVTGSQRFAADLIAAASGLKPGDIITRDDIQAGADRIAQLGPFRNVRYKFTSRADVVDIDYALEDAPAVPVLFDNFPTLGDDEIIAAMKAAVPWFDGTAPEQGLVLDGMTAALQALLEKRGIKAVVERTLLAGPGDSGMIQQFRMTGPPLTMTAIEFDHPLARESTKLGYDIADIRNKPYSRFAVMVFAEEHVRPLFQSKGFLRVKFGPPLARFEGNPNRPLPDKVSVVVSVDAGPAYQFAGAMWQGSSAFTAEQLNSLLGMTAGEVASGVKLEAGWERVRKEYARAGFIEAKVEPEPVFDDAKREVRFRARITEGAEYKMGDLVITGLSVPAERKLTAAWQLPRGVIFNRSYFEDFLEIQVRKRQAWGEYVVTFNEVGHFLRANPATKTVDVLLDFK